MRDWPIRSWPLNLTDRDHNAILTTFSTDELLDQFLIIHVGLTYLRGGGWFNGDGESQPLRLLEKYQELGGKPRE
jgi:hypothetical protein